MRLPIKKESRDLYVQWVFYVGSLISISNHNIHRDVGFASFSTGSGNEWILTAPVELCVMEYKQEDLRGEQLDGIKPSSLYERTTHSPIMCTKLVTWYCNLKLQYTALSDRFSIAVLSGNAARRRFLVARERGEEGEWNEWEGGGRTKKKGTHVFSSPQFNHG